LKVCVYSYGKVWLLLLIVGDGTVLWQLLSFCNVTILDGDNQNGFCGYSSYYIVLYDELYCLIFLLVRTSLFGQVLITTRFRFIYYRWNMCIFQAMYLYQVKNPYLPKLAVNT
jgi:hypothetical protein